VTHSRTRRRETAVSPRRRLRVVWRLVASIGASSASFTDPVIVAAAGATFTISRTRGW